MSTFGARVTSGGNIQAGADLSAKQFYPVALSGTDRQVVQATAGDAMYGILQNTPIAGQPCEIDIFGETKAIAGAGGWVTGDSLDVGAAGLVIHASGVVVAIAIDTVAAGNVGFVKVLPTAG